MGKCHGEMVPVPWRGDEVEWEVFKHLYDRDPESDSPSFNACFFKGKEPRPGALERHRRWVERNLR